MKLHDFNARIILLLFYVFISIPECIECISLGERIGRRVTLSWHPHDPSPPPSPSPMDHNSQGSEMPVEPDDSSFCGTCDWMEKGSGDTKYRQMLSGGFQYSSVSPTDALNNVVGDQDGMQRYSSIPLRSMDGSHIRGRSSPTISR